jgi:hypothetical protein
MYFFKSVNPVCMQHCKGRSRNRIVLGLRFRHSTDDATPVLILFTFPEKFSNVLLPLAR